jgi:hypothetical protein
MDKRGNSLRKRKFLKIFINLVIFISWVTMMVFLINKESILKNNEAESNFRELIPQGIEVDAWKSISISDQWGSVGRVCTYDYRSIPRG